MVCSAEGTVRAQAGALLWLEERDCRAGDEALGVGWVSGGHTGGGSGVGQGHRCFLIFLGVAVPSHGSTTLRK